MNRTGVVLVQASEDDAAGDPPSAEVESRSSCPRCGGALRSADVQPHGLLGCVSCGGVFLNHSGVRAVLTEGHAEIESMAARLASVVQSRPPRDAEAGCPVCAAPMTPVAIRGGVATAFTCNAHGSWFDAGDVARLGAPVAAMAHAGELGLAAPSVDLAPALIDASPAGFAAYSPVGLLTRARASILDGLFLLPAFGFTVFLPVIGTPFVLVLLFGFGSILACACLQMYCAATRGQTWGKKQAGIRVVRIDGSPAGGYRMIVLRNLVPYYLIPAALSAAGQVLETASETVPAALLVPVAMTLAPAWFLFTQVGILLVFLPPRRAIHDYVAGTIVVPA